MKSASRQALGHRARTTGLDLVALDQVFRQPAHRSGVDPATARDRPGAGQQGVHRQAHRRHGATAQPLLGHEVQAAVAALAWRGSGDVLAKQAYRAGRGAGVLA